MRKNLLLSEVLTNVHNAPVNEKAKLLKAYETPGLLSVLRYAFCPNLEFDTGIPEYNASIRPAGTDVANLQAEARRLYIFEKSYQKVPPQRKREILLQILESIHATEAKLLCQVIKKDVKVNGLTPELVESVFPGLLAWRDSNGQMVQYEPINQAIQKQINGSGPFNSTETPNAFEDTGIKVPKSKNRKVIV